MLNTDYNIHLAGEIIAEKMDSNQRKAMKEITDSQIQSAPIALFCFEKSIIKARYLFSTSGISFMELLIAKAFVPKILLPA